MRHRLAGRHLGRDTAHRTAMYRNLVTDLLRYERITTTEAKAKEIRPMAEKIITLGRRGDLEARRQALRFVFDEDVVRKLFDDLGPRMRDRPGGYLRITALEQRKGDAARMAAIEMVDRLDPAHTVALAAPVPPPPSPAAEAPKRARGRQAVEAVAEELAVEAEASAEEAVDAVAEVAAGAPEDPIEAMAEESTEDEKEKE